MKRKYLWFGVAPVLPHEEEFVKSIIKAKGGEMTAICEVCKEQIHWFVGGTLKGDKGWVHKDGYVYGRTIVNGELKATHPAHPARGTIRQELTPEEVLLHIVICQ